MKITLKTMIPCLLTVTALVATSQMVQAVDYCAEKLENAADAKRVCPYVCKSHGGWGGGSNYASYPCTNGKNDKNCQCFWDPSGKNFFENYSVCGCNK